MPDATARRHRTPSAWFIFALLLAVPMALAQGGGQRGGAPAGGAAPAASARSAAPVDLTGYWVSVVTEDWIERMSPDSPPSGTGGRGGLRGQATTPPPNADPCRVYGAAGSLRVPGRLNIAWVDDNTLKIDMDAGKQSRLLHFNPPATRPTEKTLQGFSVANWEVGPPPRGGGGGGGGRGGAAPPRWGTLRAVTTNMKSGYLLSSRSEYSDNATLTEYFARHTDFGTDYFTVTAVVEDRGQTRVTSSTFKKEPNGSKFSPTGCEVVR
jgi:hypothetical protein